MIKKILALLVLTIFLAACSGLDMVETPTTGYPLESDTEKPSTGYPVETETQAPATGCPVETTTPDLQDTADLVINALAEKDIAAVAERVLPEMGVRFSPYAYVRQEHHVFFPGELLTLIGSDEVYTWGTYDGSGEPIELTFDEYYEEFVYSSDFADPEQMAVNERIGQGNSINNIDDFFPGSSFVEYHFSGFEEQYEGMDWESLRLVFVEENGTWWLVGIVHDEWTI